MSDNYHTRRTPHAVWYPMPTIPLTSESDESTRLAVHGKWFEENKET